MVSIFDSSLHSSVYFDFIFAIPVNGITVYTTEPTMRSFFIPIFLSPPIPSLLIH